MFIDFEGNEDTEALVEVTEFLSSLTICIIELLCSELFEALC